MFKVLNYLSISQKMILIFIGCVILPMTVLTGYYYNDTEKKIQDLMMQRLTSTLSEKADKVNGCVDGAVSLSKKICMNEDLSKLLDSNYSGDVYGGIANQQSIKGSIALDLIFTKQVRDISIYSDNPTLLKGALIKTVIPFDSERLGEDLLEYKSTPLNSEENNSKLRISLLKNETQTGSDRGFSIISLLNYYPQYTKFHKLLRIDLDTFYISSILADNVLFDNIVLVDSDSRVIASANKFHECGRYDILSLENLGAGIVALHTNIGDYPLKVYGFYNSQLISEEFKKMRLKTLVNTFYAMLLALIFILLVARNITKRTHLLVNQSEQIAKGNFIELEKGNIGSDEIGILAMSINLMSVQLKTLIDEKYKSRLLKAQLERETAQARLLALQSQVNPHFMFNALECIRLKAAVKNENETAKMIMYMSRMFRHLINWDEDIIPLQEDIKFLEEFLKLQKYRFDNEFEYIVEVDEQAKYCLLPKLIIQPLVENACVHGVEAISVNRLVEIHASIRDNRLIVKISDNGSGISEEKLTELREMLDGGKKLEDSVGLYNVYQRLLLNYGKDFSFEVTSENGLGTHFYIDLPVRFSREEFCVLDSID